MDHKGMECEGAEWIHVDPTAGSSLTLAEWPEASANSNA
jgi:hypothetical protein